MLDSLLNLWQSTGLYGFFNLDPSAGFGWGNFVMILVGFLLFYLAIKKGFEPLLLIPIGMGCVLSNIPFAYIAGSDPTLAAGAQGATGFIKILFDAGIQSGLFPILIFMGVGAMTDFGPLIANPKTLLLGAAAQFGIFAALIGALLLSYIPGINFDLHIAASIGIIGGADGPTAIFTTIKLAPHLLGPIAIAAYSYMALVPVIIPLVVRLTCSKKELTINMKEQDKKFPAKNEIKNMRTIKILFPIAVTTIVAIFVPTAVSLIGMLMFGNLLKEIGSDTSRLFDTISNSIMNTATVFLGLCVGATMTAQAFLNWTTIGIIIGGFLAFALSIMAGITMVKIMNLFVKKKINPLIGATGLSAVPMASRVCNEIATKYDPKNHVLNYCMSSNISGVIGSAVAAGVLIKFLS